MARSIFISYQHEDQMQAKGFNLLRWNKNVDFEFVGRHLLDPVDSSNEKYIRSKLNFCPFHPPYAAGARA